MIMPAPRVQAKALVLSDPKNCVGNPSCHWKVEGEKSKGCSLAELVLMDNGAGTRMKQILSKIIRTAKENLAWIRVKNPDSVSCYVIERKFCQPGGHRIC